MNIDKNDPAGTSGQTEGQIESLESTEIPDVDLEKVSGGMTLHPGIAASGGCLTI